MLDSPRSTSIAPPRRSRSMDGRFQRCLARMLCPGTRAPIRAAILPNMWLAGSCSAARCPLLLSQMPPGCSENCQDDGRTGRMSRQLARRFPCQGQPRTQCMPTGRWGHLVENRAELRHSTPEWQSSRSRCAEKPAGRDFCSPLPTADEISYLDGRLQNDAGVCHQPFLGPRDLFRLGR